MKNSLFCKICVIFAAITMICTMAFPAFAGESAPAQTTALPFDADHWTVENGTLPGGSTLTVNNEKTLLHTKDSYGNFRLTYKVRYSTDSTNRNPWYGEFGVLLRSENQGLDGLWIGFYGYDSILYCSTGNYVDNTYYAMTGVDAGWGTAGYDEHTIDLYVFGGSCNIVINGWLFQNLPVPYDAEGHISLIADGVCGSISDVSVQPLADDFDYASLITRANWQGNNFSGEQWYWYEAGKDQMFRMRLPDDLAGVTKYYLARVSKYCDKGQDVDVYVDPTGTKGFDQGLWGEKAFTWGDYNGPANSTYGVNMVEIDPAIFGDAKAGDAVGFYLAKEQDGWYSANNYWLLYEKDGKIYVADYLDLIYGFDRDAHAYTWDEANSYHRGYWFIRQEDLSLVSSLRGEEARFVQNPVISKLQDLTYTFAHDEGAKTFDLQSCLNVDKKGIGYTLSYAIDGVAVDTVTFAPEAKSGVITVTCSPDGNSLDNGGTVWFEPQMIEIAYTLTVAEAPLPEPPETEEPDPPAVEPPVTQPAETGDTIIALAMLGTAALAGILLASRRSGKFDKE